MVDRSGLESQVQYDLRALNADTNRLERLFASMHNVSNNDLDALRHIIVSETAGTPLSSGDLRERLGVSAAAITYLVDRMIEGGHVRRESDPTDRRRVILRYSEHGSQVAREFFHPMQVHTHNAMAAFSDEELNITHRVLVAMSGALQSYHDEVVAQNAQ